MALAELTSPRRILTALLLAILLGGTTIGIVGVASAGDGDGLFPLPARHVGDKATYATFYGNATYEQKDLMAWKDGLGSWHVADVAERIVNFPSAGEELEFRIPSLLEAGTWIPLGASHGSSSSSFSSTDLLGGAQSEKTYTQRITLGVEGHLCGFVNSLQGADTGDDRILLAGCTGDGPSTFHLTDTTTYGDLPALVYEDQYGQRVTFAQGIPYPVSYTSGNFTYTLTGMERGDDAFTQPEIPGPDTPMPDVRPVAADRMGPSWDGLVLPYPLKDAVADARDDPTFSNVRDFMEQNPDWYVQSADFQVAQDTQVWWIEFTAERNAMALLVQRSPSAVGSVAGTDLPAGLGWDLSYMSLEHDPDGLPLADLPATLPSPADVVAAWRTYDDQTGMPSSIGFRYPSCWNSTCTNGTVYAGEVGYVSYSSGSSSLLGITDPPVQESTDGVTLEYTTKGLESVWLSKTYRESSGGPLASPRMDGDGRVEDAPSNAAAIGWSSPGNKATTTISLVSLLIAAAYYLWPLAKGLPFLGLWTRRRGGQELLDHPVRRALYDHIQARPGIHYQELVRRVGRGQGAVEHHLRRLQEVGLVSVVRKEGYTCHFATGSTDRRAMAAAPALRSEGAKAVLATIQAHPGATVSEVARRTGLSPGTVAHHLKRLKASGAVEAARDGRSVRLRAAAWMTA